MIWVRLIVRDIKYREAQYCISYQQWLAILLIISWFSWNSYQTFFFLICVICLMLYSFYFNDLVIFNNRG